MAKLRKSLNPTRIVSLSYRNKSKQILVAPLYWGLIHAVRCIPTINALLAEGNNPIVASDGCALEFLRKKLPQQPAWLKLPS